jgi:hypothetical protein
MTHRALSCALALGFAVTYPVPRAAQSQAAPAGAAAAAPARGGACFRARPLPRCRSFWITEFGVLSTQSRPQRYSDPAIVVWELGRMYNLTERRALGASVMFATGDDLMRLGVKARYRVWLNEVVAAELAPGILVLSSDNDMNGRGGAGFVAHGAVTLQDWVTALAQVDVRRSGLASFLGLKLGSVPGTVVGLAVPAAFGVLLATYHDRS